MISYILYISHYILQFVILIIILMSLSCCADVSDDTVSNDGSYL